MKKKVTDVDPKYVDMLNKAYEKYLKLEVVNSNFEHYDETEPEPAKFHTDKLDAHAHQGSDNIQVINNRTLTPKPNSDKSKKLKYKNYTNYGHKKYSEEENEILINFLEKNPNFSHSQNKKSKLIELAKIMEGRTINSIRSQINLIQTEPELMAKKRTKKIFSLTEDKLIIDEAIRHLQQCKSLRDTVIQNPRDFCKTFKRSYRSIEERWESYIKCWLLQYYNKNLNQEIKPMLVDLIHRNYDSIPSIDWEFIANHKEFSGYNISGLKKELASAIRKAAMFHNKASYELSLKEIAKLSKENLLNTKRTPALAKRIMDCIEYFELKVRDQNISCSKT